MFTNLQRCVLKHEFSLLFMVLLQINRTFASEFKTYYNIIK